MSQKKICIIGAGLAGLGAIQLCHDENLEPVCYEAQGSIGGLWRYSEEDIEGRGCVMKSTIINSSKEMSCMSNFIIDENLPNYMHNTKMIENIESFSNNLNLKKHILFYHKIISVIRTEDYDQSGKWKAKICDLKSGKEFEEIFDGVMVCTGHHTYPMMPEFPGQEKFRGKILHTHSFKSFQPYLDQNVVVVGAGNSAMDSSVDVSQVTKQTYLSTRTGAWIVPRVGPWGIPIDIIAMSRLMNCVFNYLPYSFNCFLAESLANYYFDHELYGLKPKHRFYDQHSTVQDVLPNKIISGAVKVKGNIKEFTEDGVIFDNETTATPVDTVIMATGYKIHFPFLSEDVIKVKDNKVKLFKYTFPIDHKHPTMAFIGLFQTLGGGIPAGEIQMRWVTRVLNGKVKLPSKEFMKKETEEYFEYIYQRFRGTPCHTIHADFINLMDQYASMIGVKPNLFKMLLTDPKLFMYCFFGPCLPYQYRLTGPGAWEGARNAILTYKQRVKKPFAKNNSTITEQKSQPINYIRIVFIVSLIMFIISFFCSIF